MSLADFEVIKRFGEGAYSSVFHVRRTADQQVYALKKVKMGKLSDKEKENALNEVRILASIEHPSICYYREAFVDDQSSSLCIVMEYADDGDMF
jgi:NIMA (never in mitosis gene a)-related kinase